MKRTPTLERTDCGLQHVMPGCEQTHMDKIRSVERLVAEAERKYMHGRATGDKRFAAAMLEEVKRLRGILARLNGRSASQRAML